MEWFRMYVESVDDHKVQKLPGDLYKFWVNCLCLTRENDGVLPPAEKLAWRLKLSQKKLDFMLAQLIKEELLEDQSAGRLVPHNWNDRQYASDVSTARVKRFRERQRNVATAAPIPVAVPAPKAVSLSESVSVSEGFSEELLDPEAFCLWLYARHPRKKALPVVQAQIVALLAGDSPERLFPIIAAVHTECCASDEWRKENGRYVPRLDLWLSDKPWIGWKAQRQVVEKPRMFIDPLGDNVPEFADDGDANAA